jgi:hypothetical protein
MASYRDSFAILKGKYHPVVKKHTMDIDADVKVLKLSYFSTTSFFLLEKKAGTCGKRPEKYPVQVLYTHFAYLIGLKVNLT